MAKPRAWDQPGLASLRAITGNTTSGTPNTVTDVAHGLTDVSGNAIVPTIAFTQNIAADDNNDNAFDESVHVTAIDDTNVSVKCGVASVTFTLYVG